MGLFDDFIDGITALTDAFGGGSSDSDSKNQARSQALGAIGFGLSIAEVENERRVAKEQERAIRREVASVARQGGQVLEENQLNARRAVASQRASFGATGLNLVGTGAGGEVILDTLTESLRRQRLIQDRTQTQVDRLLRRGAAIRRSANRARILGFVGSTVELFANSQSQE